MANGVRAAPKSKFKPTFDTLLRDAGLRYACNANGPTKAVNVHKALGKPILFVL